MSKRIYSDEELLEDLKKINKNQFNNEAITRNRAKQYLTASIATYENRFGSWNDCLRKANIKVEHEVNIPKEKLIEEIKRVSKEQFDGQPPSCRSMNEYSRYSNKTFQDKFGSWNDALFKAGFEVNQEPNYDENDLLNDLQRVSEEYCNGETPQANNVDLHGKWTTPVYYRVFESFNKALEQACFSRTLLAEREATDTETEALRNSKLKEKIHSRDNHVCGVCSSENSHGYKPDIHHITPHNYWRDEEHEEMNHPRNLICLCRSCHRKLEGKFKGRSYEEFKCLAKDYLDMEEALDVRDPSTRSVFDY